jgi:hypothetical protein
MTAPRPAAGAWRRTGAYQGSSAGARRTKPARLQATAGRLWAPGAERLRRGGGVVAVLIFFQFGT